MTGQAEDNPASVPEAQQAGVASRLWSSVKPCVWTARMVTTLISGVEGGKWFRLYDKVFSERNLIQSFQQVARNRGAAGVDHVSTEEFAAQVPENIWHLSDTLREGTYRPQSIRRMYIPKPGTQEQRPLGIPTVRDRIVQAAVVNVIEPIFERDFAEQSYGFRPGRGCKDALRRVTELLRSGYIHVVDADLKGYFDTIPHARLIHRLEEKIADGRVLSLITSFLEAGIMDGEATVLPTSGAPQGAVLSPLLSNVYLDPLDHLMANSGYAMVRYADDFVILCRTADEASRGLEMVQHWVIENGLTLHPTKTRIVDSRTESFTFLGYEFRGQAHWPRQKSLQSLKDSLRPLTRRTSGNSLPCVIAQINPKLRGWFQYFKHSTIRTIYRNLDGWLRMRLRSLLRKRTGRRGRSRGTDNRQWPNHFFRALGLYSLVEARQSLVHSSRR